MSRVCTNCHAEIPAATVGEVCPSCAAPLGETRQMAHPPTLENVDLSAIDTTTPPSGAWTHPAYDGVRIGATRRSARGMLTLPIAAAAWLAISGFFTFSAYASAWAHLTGRTEVLPGYRLTKDLPMPVGMTVFTCIFMVPFVFVGLYLVWTTLLAWGGKTEVHVGSSSSAIFNGIGSIGRSRRFDKRSITDVRLESRSVETKDGDTVSFGHIALDRGDGRKPILLGKSLTPERRRYVAAAVKRAIAKL